MDTMKMVEQDYLKKEMCIRDRVYAAQSADVDTVIIDGRIVMENKKVLTIDRERVFQEVEERVQRLLSEVK